MSEQISALIDGEVDDAQLTKRIEDVLSNKNAVNVSRDYQMIGDAMRGELASSDQLTQSIMEKIEQEPTVLSPNAITQLPTQTDTSNSVVTKKPIPRIWSVAASVAAVMVVGLFAINQEVAQPEASFIAAAQTAPAKPVNTPTISRASIPTQYLEAHRASAPSVGSHYIQAANFSE